MNALLRIGLATLSISACAVTTVPAKVDSTSSPVLTAPAPAAADAFGRFDLWFPAEIRPAGDGPVCGFPAERKLAARLDEPVMRGSQVWRITGCVASRGNTFYDVTLVLSFPDGTTKTLSVLDHTDSAQDSPFAGEIARNSIAGMQARLYVNYARK